MVRFAIKLRSFSRLHQLKHVTRDNDGVSPALATTGSDEDLASSEVDTVCSSEEPQLNTSLESCQSCIPVAEEGGTGEEEEALEKKNEEEEEDEVEHSTSQMIGGLERLGLDEAEITANSQVDGSILDEQLLAVASPVRGFAESDITSSCTAVAQYHLTCTQSGAGGAASPPAQQSEDSSRLGEPDTLSSANSELVLGFSDLLHLMHACRCNAGVNTVSHYHDQDATVPSGVSEHPCHVRNAPLGTGLDKAESRVLVLNSSKEDVGIFREGVQPSHSHSQEAASSRAVAMNDDDFKEGRELGEDAEEEDIAQHRAREPLTSTETEEDVLESHSPSWEVRQGTGIAEDASAIPIMDAWVSPKIWDGGNSGCDSSSGSSKVLPPSTDHQTNALVLESFGQSNGSPTASPSEMWRNESD